MRAIQSKAKAAASNRAKRYFIHLMVACSFVQTIAAAVVASSDQLATEPLESRSLATQGIVVPKRTSLIVGLNQQFKLRASDRPATSSANNSSTLVAAAAAGLHWPLSILQPRRPQQQHSNNHQQQQQQHLQSSQQLSNPKQTLYLDRHQQEILAANPNLLNPANLPNALLTRSAADRPAGHQFELTNLQNDSPSRAAQLEAGSNSAGLDLNEGQQQQQQLYRGYSLIELDVKSDSDRRYIQELYGNLSLALDEQAKNPHALTISPYVDVDFWSFRQALNDQIDIMVSPKSRAFILAQLNKAKIRHRIKIDDIQARLDQQQQPANLAAGSSQPSRPQLAGNSPLSGRTGIISTSASATANAINLDGKQIAPLDGRQAAAAASSKPINESQFFENYQRLADVNQYLESIVEKNRDIAQIKVIGRSSQGRYLRVLKLGYDQQDIDGSTGSNFLNNEPRNAGQYQHHHQQQQQPPSPPPIGNASFIVDTFFRKQAATKKLGSIWLDGGTHAREWISPSTVLYIAFRLSDNHNKCYHFFESLKAAVQASAAAQEMSSSFENRRRAKRYSGSNSLLDESLVNGINEINSSLLGKPVKLGRPRTELEHTLELLAKSPQEVASGHGCDLEIDQLLRRYTFFIMPVLNPDGYEYSHTHNRLWRKTRSTSNHPIYRHFCLGADPNRNYDARHGATGSSTHPCSQTFAGSVPFTEPETRHHSNFVYANRLGMKMYVSFHSYSQMILLPFSHSKQLAPDHKDLESVGLAAAKAIEQTHGTVYRVGPSASILYTASGTASDWAYEKAGIKYSYTMELRDTGTYGFLLPRQQIIPTGEETFNGLLAMVNQMEKNDNLLTSKSTPFVSVAFDRKNDDLTNNRSATINQQSIDYNHVPVDPVDSAGLRQQQQQQLHRSRAPLENVLGGWSSSAGESSLVGVRDRRPTTTLVENSNFEAAAAASSPIGDEEVIDNDNEPDAGYAFEGEGELMEPSSDKMAARDLSDSSGTILSSRAAARRVDHSRRIAQSAGLSATGRSSINSPIVSNRDELSGRAAVKRRESSEDLQHVGYLD